MLKRTIVGIVFAAGVVGIGVFGPDYMQIAAVGILMVLAQYEMMGALRAGGQRPMNWLGYAFALLSIAALAYRGLETVWALYLLIIMLAFTVRVLSRRVTTEDLLASLVPLVYPLPLFTVMLQTVLAPQPMGRTTLLCGIAFACLTDVFAYFVGSTLGKHKLCPELSPKKSVEGAAGGVVGSMLTAVALYFLQFVWGADFPWWMYVICAPFCSIMGQIGDLAASAIKRQTGIKDYGTLFPGHGGVLDRFDSILFSVPIAYLFFNYIFIFYYV